MTARKKLIEVALPLAAIDEAARREKSPFTRSHPRALHVWWARRPLVACRAILFASLVDDPSSRPDRFPSQEDQQRERERLFRIVEKLVRWENSNDKQVLEEAQTEILRSAEGSLPPVLDPFSGGGSISVEAQRLGLQAFASDLNPVAVLITKALIEIPSRFAERPPINTKDRGSIGGKGGWQGLRGLAADVRFYGAWMLQQAEQRIGYLYPSVHLAIGRGERKATPMTWIWARTVVCPNPACGADMILVRSFWLSTKKGKEAWLQPVVRRDAKKVRFEVRTGQGKPPDTPKVGRGAQFRCLVCEQVADEEHIKREGMAKRMNVQLMAIVANDNGALLYLPASEDQVAVAWGAQPTWTPDAELSHDPRNIWCAGYGLSRIRDLFTERQLVALETFSDLVSEARDRALVDAVAASGQQDDGVGLDQGGAGPRAYAEAVATYLGLSVSRFADFSNAICSWDSGNTNLRQLFARQAIPMAWDFAETNPLHGTVTLQSAVTWATSAFEFLQVTKDTKGQARQLDSTASINSVANPLICTDPPYYDNISYAALSDFFYVWLRRSVGRIFPELFATVLTPKNQELIATPYRFNGDRKQAEHFFEDGLGKAFERMREVQNPAYPMTLYYAFRQAETNEGDGSAGAIVASTGWQTMLEGLLKAGFVITGTWPMRTEQPQRSVAAGTNALASSVVLVCRPRDVNAPLCTRRDFLAALNREFPDALKRLQQGNIAPVDLAQAAIGPGMAVFSRYSKVLEADGSIMQVRTALSLINQALDEVLAGQESEWDGDTRWTIAWFDQYGMEEGPYGVAERLSTAKNTSVRRLVAAGFLHAKGGKVRLLRRDELKAHWDPIAQPTLTVWEATQFLIRTLQSDGETAAADLARRVGGLGESARDLAYRLYATSERKRWAQEALAYNSLVLAWPEITRVASGRTSDEPRQATLL